MRATLVLCAVLISILAGKLTADASVRLISLLLLGLAALVAMHLRPRTLLVLTLAATPLPLYMQGLRGSLTPVLVVGVLIAALATRPAVSVQLGRYPVLLGALLVAALVSMTRGESLDTAADLAALGRLLVGMALFVLCLLLLRSREDVGFAFRALAVAGLVVFTLTAAGVVLPGISIPGMRGGFATVNIGESGISQNVRFSGPIGDYELLAEFFALMGTLALFLATREGARRAIWLGSFAASFVGIALTSTRSGVLLLALGTVAVIASTGRRIASPYVLASAAILAVATTVLPVLQARFGTGFVLERLATTRFEGGIGGTLNRTKVWESFLARFPDTSDALLGSGPAFDFSTYASYPHSLPLTLIFSLGLAGTIAFFALATTVVVSCVRAWRAERAPYAYAGALLTGLFLLNELKIEYVRTFNYEWFVWALLGVCAAAGRARS